MKKADTSHFLPRPATPRYRQQYGVIVVCRDEADQAKLYQQLLRRAGGRSIKVVVT